MAKWENPLPPSPRSGVKSFLGLASGYVSRTSRARSTDTCAYAAMVDLEPMLCNVQDVYDPKVKENTLAEFQPTASRTSSRWPGASGLLARSCRREKVPTAPRFALVESSPWHQGHLGELGSLLGKSLVGVEGTELAPYHSMSLLPVEVEPTLFLLEGRVRCDGEAGCRRPQGGCLGRVQAQNACSGLSMRVGPRPQFGGGRADDLPSARGRRKSKCAMRKCSTSTTSRCRRRRRKMMVLTTPWCMLWPSLSLPKMPLDLGLLARKVRWSAWKVPVPRPTLASPSRRSRFDSIPQRCEEQSVELMPLVVGCLCS